jgi:prolyl-tRNA synthetase
MPVTKDDGTVVLALVRGDDRLEEAKLGAALGAPFRPSSEEEIRAAFGADPGSLGPVGFTGEIVADDALREGQFVAGANRTGWHLRGVEHGRDFTARFADIRLPIEGDTCPNCGGRLGFQTAIEVGHIFKLGTQYSAPLGARFLDENGEEQPVLMGCYGIGPAASWPPLSSRATTRTGSSGPLDRSVRRARARAARCCARRGAEPAVEVAELLSARGSTCCWTTGRSARGESSPTQTCSGFRFGSPWAKKTLDDGAVDVRIRATGADDRIPRETVLSWIGEL